MVSFLRTHIKRRMESHRQSNDDEVCTFLAPDILLFEFLCKGKTTLFAANLHLRGHGMLS